MSNKLVQKLATEPHVAQAMGEVIAPIVGFDAIMGIDPAEFTRMSGGFDFISGHTFQGPDDLLVEFMVCRPKTCACGQHFEPVVA